MMVKVWRALVEVTQPNEPGSDQALIEPLGAAFAELNLPPAFLERIQTAVTEAIRRFWQHDKDHAAHLTVAAHVLHMDGVQMGQSWGFFLIEKRLENRAGRRIEVLLYPEVH